MTWAQSIENKKILLVEDDKYNQELVMDIFDGTGCILDMASNGGEALLLYRNAAYDFVLMDVHMPGQDGIEVTKVIRQYEKEQSRVSGTNHCPYG